MPAVRACHWQLGGPGALTVEQLPTGLQQYITKLQDWARPRVTSVTQKQPRTQERLLSGSHRAALTSAANIARSPHLCGYAYPDTAGAHAVRRVPKGTALARADMDSGARLTHASP